MIRLAPLFIRLFRLASLSPIHTPNSGRTPGAEISKTQFWNSQKGQRRQRHNLRQLIFKSLWSFSLMGLQLGIMRAINANQHRFLNSEQPRPTLYEISSFSDSASLQRGGPEHALGSDPEAEIYSEVQPGKEEVSHEARVKCRKLWGNQPGSFEVNQLPKAWWSLLCLV